MRTRTLGSDRTSVASLLAMTVALSATVVFGQLPAQVPPRFTAGTELIQLDVVVLDAAGRPVEGLTAADFRLFDSNQETRVEVASEVRIPAPERSATWMRSVSADVATNAPVEEQRLVMLVIDDGRLSPFGSARTNVQQIARDVIAQLGPQDLASVVFTANNRVAQDFTADKGLLNATIDVMGHGGGRGGPPVFLPYSIDILSRSAASLIQIKSRRKVLIYIGGGHNVYVQPGGGSKPEVPGRDPWGLAGRTDSVMRDAQKAGVAIYVIDPSGSRVRNTQWNLRAQYLNDLSGFTGAVASVGSDDHSAAVERIFEESGHYYVLGFRPPAEGPANAFRQLRVEVARPGVTVRTRAGYFTPRAPDADTPDPNASAPPVSRALSGILPATEIALRASLTAFGDWDAETDRVGGHVALLMGLDAPPGPLDVEVRVFDGEGRREFAVDRHARVRPGGSEEEGGRSELLWAMALKPGRYSVRAAVHDPETGLSGGVYNTVTVPDFAGRTPSASGVFLSITPASPAAELTPWPSSMPYATVQRRFLPGDHVRAVVRVHPGSTNPRSISSRVTITDAHDQRRLDETRTLSPTGPRAPWSDVTLDLPLRTLPDGQYLLRFEFTTGRNSTLTRDVVFSVAR